MANEVIIIEAREAKVQKNGIIFPVLGLIETTQVLDIGTRSVQLNSNTAIVRIRAKDTGFWYKLGDSTVIATAATDGNLWLDPGAWEDLEVFGFDYINTTVDV